MNFERVAIIGTDAISASIALGLKAQKQPPQIIGYDADVATANLARSRGIFDLVERRPGQACRGAELVVVAVPIPAIRDTFAAIAPYLQPGCFVTDTAYLKAPVMRWAEELLPASIFFVGGHLIPNPAIAGSSFLRDKDLEAASADLLRKALYCLTAPAGASGQVIDVFSDLATTLHARPFFIDITEHDGLQAGVEGLPAVLAIALLRATVDTPGWQEMRKFASHRFAAATMAADEIEERSAAVFLNRQNVLLRLDALLDELVHLRDLLTQEDGEPFQEMLAATAEGRSRWIEEQEQGMWVRDLAVDTSNVPSAGEQLRRMFFGAKLARQRNREE
ncbi:MAG: hypothetical protein DRI48_06825 [Chloroflexi bacterium]|nr:MAG: hypothetical protein DRI48_06825 [Chloroflexota bacterium]